MIKRTIKEVADLANHLIKIREFIIDQQAQSTKSRASMEIRLLDKMNRGKLSENEKYLIGYWDAKRSVYEELYKFIDDEVGI